MHLLWLENVDSEAAGGTIEPLHSFDTCATSVMCLAVTIEKAVPGSFISFQLYL